MLLTSKKKSLQLEEYIGIKAMLRFTKETNWYWSSFGILRINSLQNPDKWNDIWNDTIKIKSWQFATLRKSSASDDFPKMSPLCTPI